MKEKIKMKKSNFVALVFGVVGGLLFALGMCMALIPEWDLFKQGIITGAAGLVVLLLMVLIWRRMEKKVPIKISGKVVGGVLIGVVGALLLGIGMCFVLVWDRMLMGIFVGVVGIIVLLCLIPFLVGLK